MPEHTIVGNELTSGLVVEQISWPHPPILAPVNNLTKSSKAHEGLKNTGLVKQLSFGLWTYYKSRSFRKKQPYKHVADRLPPGIV